MIEVEGKQHINEYLASELTACELAYLKKFSGGIFYIEDFVPQFEGLGNSKPKRSKGYSLGLDNFIDEEGNKPYYLVSQILHLTDWKQGYLDHGLEWKKVGPDRLQDLIHQYLEIITSENHPIAFFVPSSIRSHNQSGTTCWEIEWCLKSPNKAKIERTYFVFGLYQNTHCLARYV